MTATWVLAAAILIDQGTSWRAWAVFAGTMLTTMLVVSRQVLAFQHIAQLLRERDDLATRLTDLAYRDGLTGLANRRAFIDTLSERLGSGVPVAVLLIDLDRFKPVNDAFGHAAGDRLLVEVAGRLGAVARAGDTVARLGGDEFAILASGLSARAAGPFADQVRRTLRGTVPIGDARVTFSGSVGMAVGTCAQYDADGLLHAADMDMYARKSTACTGQPGRDRSSPAALR
jgi:diguanylate cyclase (GGDEF)-like protein